MLFVLPQLGTRCSALANFAGWIGGIDCSKQAVGGQDGQVKRTSLSTSNKNQLLLEHGST
jgi:hypothetical protein